MANLKTLRVCLSEDLPLITERDPNYIYFLYDKLTIFRGQSLHEDPYIIVENIPDNPIRGMLYFVLNDGTVKVYTEYGVRDVALIESKDQIEILRQLGTMFFIYSDKRYLDLQRRIITLPYRNGTYELTVSAANNLKLDKDTVIAFNPETNQFDIVGKREDFDLVFTSRYRGKDTKTADTKVENHSIHTDIKISPAYDNILKFVNDGLYANVNDRVTKEEFNRWYSVYQEYKSNMEAYLRDLAERIENTHGDVSEETINKKIHDALTAVYPEIDEILSRYETIAEEFEEIEIRSKSYTDKEVQNAYNELYKMVIEVTDDPWENF